MDTSEKIFFNNLQKQGITPVDYQAFQIMQGNACAICDKEQKRRLTVYVNKEGKMKGLLCTSCTIATKTPRETLEKILDFIK